MTAVRSENIASNDNGAVKQSDNVTSKEMQDLSAEKMDGLSIPDNGSTLNKVSQERTDKNLSVNQPHSINNNSSHFH